MASNDLDAQITESHDVSPTSETKEVDTKNNTFTSDNDVEHGLKFEPEEEGATTVVETANDLVTKVIHVQDDPTMSVVTFRVIFLGLLSHK